MAVQKQFINLSWMGIVCLMVTMMDVDIVFSGEFGGENKVLSSKYDGNGHCDFTDATNIYSSFHF